MKELFKRLFILLGAFCFVSSSIYIYFNHQLWVPVQDDPFRFFALVVFHLVWGINFVIWVLGGWDAPPASPKEIHHHHTEEWVPMDYSYKRLK